MACRPLLLRPEPDLPPAAPPFPMPPRSFGFGIGLSTIFNFMVSLLAGRPLLVCVRVRAWAWAWACEHGRVPACALACAIVAPCMHRPAPRRSWRPRPRRPLPQILSLVISVVFSVINNFTNKPTNSNKKFDDEDW